jgi:hypothetical protein
VSHPSPPSTVLDALTEAIRRAAEYNPNAQTAPAAVLWPDPTGEWEPLISRLRERLPIYRLGSYDPAAVSGPAYWLRCIVGRALPEAPADGQVPVLYLPGVGRADLRAVEECPPVLQPLAELQYRGALWAHRNGRDWSITGFLSSEDGGLGIELVGDGETRSAAARALIRLADEPVSGLRRQAPLRASFFLSLLQPDAVRAILLWLSDPAGFRAGADADEWSAFRGLCRGEYAFDPDRDGEITGAERLGEREGPWAAVWQRFAEAPANYPGIPNLLRRARPQTALPLFHHADSWPQNNDAAEEQLWNELSGLQTVLPSEARAAITRLEAKHGPRRSSVWGVLGQAPLASALEPLARLAEATAQPVGGATIMDIARRYADCGWQADAALLDALRTVEDASPAEIAAVKVAAGALYRSWLEAGATALQEALPDSGDLHTAYAVEPLPSTEPGTCLLFTDGLRYDLAHRLGSAVAARGFHCDLGWRLAALPTVTGTDKPAISPVTDHFIGGPGLEPLLRGTDRRVTIDVLRRTLSGNGWQVLRGDETGDPSGLAWIEAGAIDSYGHEHGWKLAVHLAGELRTVEGRISALLDAGWRQVIVITDHGWLLLPGGLPKVQLPEHLTEVRKGRCARLKPLSQTDQRQVPWYWNPEVRIAVAPGICCYESNREYEHGGISPQECIVPILNVSLPALAAQPVSIAGIVWKGLRCVVTLEGGAAGVTVDLRSKPRDRASSLVIAPRAPNPDGTASLLVPDDNAEGETAMVVVLAGDGGILAQSPTVIGG